MEKEANKSSSIGWINLKMFVNGLIHNLLSLRTTLLVKHISQPSSHGHILGVLHRFGLGYLHRFEVGILHRDHMIGLLLAGKRVQ